MWFRRGAKLHTCVFRNVVLNGLTDRHDRGAVRLWHNPVQAFGFLVLLGWNLGMCCLQKDQETPQLKRRGSNCQAHKVVSTRQLPGADARLPPASSARPGHVTERPLCPLCPLQSRHFLLGQYPTPVGRELEEVLAQGQAQAGSRLLQGPPPNLLPPS